MRIARRAGITAAALAIAGSVAAADIVDAVYDPRTDEVVLDIAYRGTHARHAFDVQWAPCSDDGTPRQVAGRLLDIHGRDVARESFRVRVRLDLEDLPCRPVRATLRLGRVAHATVFIPEK